MESYFEKNNGGTLVFNKKFFQICFENANPNKQVVIEKLNYTPSKAEQIAIEEKHQSNTCQHPLGVQSYQIQYRIDGKHFNKLCILKSKINETQYLKMLSELLIKCGLPMETQKLASLLNQQAFKHSDVREIELYKLQINDSLLTTFMPQILGYCIDLDNQLIVLIQECITEAKFAQNADDRSSFDNSKPEGWIKQIAKMHAKWHKHLPYIEQHAWSQPITSHKSIDKLLPLWESLWQFNRKNPLADVNLVKLEQHNKLLLESQQFWAQIDNMPKTLIHNDLTMKNLALKNNNNKLIAYDWELATIHIPQRDGCEFLSYILPKDIDASSFYALMECHRQYFIQESGISIDKPEWNLGYLLALYDYLIDRLALIMAVESFEPRRAGLLHAVSWRMIDLCLRALT